MIEYNQRIDEQISDALRRVGRVSVDGLAGLDDVTGAILLKRYIEVHGSEVPLTFDGRELTWAAEAVSASSQVATGASGAWDAASSRLSPVDQVLASTPGASLLDSEPAGSRVNRVYWLLPLSLGLLGGVIGWFVAREDNPRVARSLLITGAVVQLLTVCLGVALAGVTAGLVSGTRPSTGAAAWPASSSGRATFHYFGTPN